MTKAALVLFLLIAFYATPTFAQKKGKTNPKDLQIDSLRKASVLYAGQADSLMILTDSLSKDREKYYPLYTTIKEKVLKRDFDPARLSYIIDSLAAGRDSTFSGLAATSASLMDTLKTLKRENLHMKRMMDGINAEETARNRLVNELKLLKELLDSGILTQAEFDTRKAVVLQKWR